GRYIVENFQQTPAVGDGLALMVEAYRRLAMDDLADNALLTLQTNYPDHPSLKDGEFRHHVEPAQKDAGWFKSMTTGLLDKALTPPSMNRETQMEREMEQQYQNARSALPKDIRAPQREEQQPKRSIWSRMTFGLFDGNAPTGGRRASWSRFPGTSSTSSMTRTSQCSSLPGTPGTPSRKR